MKRGEEFIVRRSIEACEIQQTQNCSLGRNSPLNGPLIV